MGARRTITRWPLIRLTAARLMLREDRAGRGVDRLLYGGLVGLAACGIPVGLGSSSLVLVAGIGLAGIAVLVGVSLRLFNAAMAVSVVGVALACASLMTALSVTAGFQLEITRALARLNGHVLLTKYGLDFFEYDEVCDRWLEHPEVTAASPFAYSMVAVVYEPGAGEAAEPDAWAEEGDVADPSAGDAADPLAGDAAAPASGAAATAPPDDQGGDAPAAGPAIVIGKGMDPARAAALEGFTEVLGTGDPSVLRPGDTRHLPGIVLGQGLARRLGAEVGVRVRVVVPAEIDGQGGPVAPPRHAAFEVLDIITTGTSEMDRNLALMHISAAQALFFRERRVTGIEFELTDPERAEAVADHMAATLPQLYRISTWRETNSPMLIGLEQIRMTLSLVLGLMVVVAASSLIASLLLLVRRKRHDIAVMMAVGGARSLVFWVFEAVGLFAGGVGALLGVGLGGLYCVVIKTFHYTFGNEVYPIDHLPVIVRPIDSLGPALAAVLLCGLASGPVAMLAARVRVLGALNR